MGLRCNLSGPCPGQSVSDGLVKVLDVNAVVAEIRPVQFGKAPGLDDRLQRTHRLRGESLEFGRTRLRCRLPRANTGRANTGRANAGRVNPGIACRGQTGGGQERDRNDSREKARPVESAISMVSSHR